MASNSEDNFFEKYTMDFKSAFEMYVEEKNPKKQVPVNPEKRMKYDEDYKGTIKHLRIVWDNNSELRKEYGLHFKMFREEFKKNKLGLSTINSINGFEVFTLAVGHIYQKNELMISWAKDENLRVMYNNFAAKINTEERKKRDKFPQYTGGSDEFLMVLHARTFPKNNDILIKLDHLEIDHMKNFKSPILVKNSENLEMEFPVNFDFDSFPEFLGDEYEFVPFETKKDRKKKLNNLKSEDIVKYFKTPHQLRINTLNFLQCNLRRFTNKLNSIVKIPKIAQTVCWYNNHWQKKEDEQPDNNLYIQFGSKGAFTDFHIDYGGTSVWFHVYKGKKVFYLVEPTEENLKSFVEWDHINNDIKENIFYGFEVDKCYRVEVTQGQTLFMPGAWIHAVETLQDSIVFAGNFLHDFCVKQQLDIYHMEKNVVDTPKQYLMEGFEELHWCRAISLLEEMALESFDQKKLSISLPNAFLLLENLKKWNKKKRYVFWQQYPCQEKKKTTEILLDLENVLTTLSYNL